MPDRISSEQRSRNMSRIRGKDTSLEIKVRSFLFKKGFRFRKNVKTLPGKPDIVLPKYKTVIFINGCFWHHHEGCRLATVPKTRTDFWNNKFNTNIANDIKNKAKLEELGWEVITIWECELKKDFLFYMNEIVFNLRRTKAKKDTIYFFKNIVSPSVEDYLNDELDERKAFIASILLYHTIDYLKYEPEIEPSSAYTQLKKYIKENNPNDVYALDLIRDICNCAKHCHLESKRKDMIVNDINSINYRKHEGFGLFNAPFSFSTFNNSGIYVKKNDLNLIPLEPAIRIIYKSLGSFIKQKLTERDFIMKRIDSAVRRANVAANVFTQLYDDFFNAFETLTMLEKYEKFGESKGWNEMTDDNCMDFLIVERIKRYLLLQTRAFFDTDRHSITFLSVINNLDDISKEELMSSYKKLENKYAPFLKNCNLIRNKVIAHHDSVFLREQTENKNGKNYKYNINDVPTCMVA